jgi:hypothetical protein
MITKDAAQAIAACTTAMLALLAVVLYFVGWTYLYGYFGFFRIDVYEIEPSIQYVLVNSVRALVQFPETIFGNPVALASAVLFISWVIAAVFFSDLRSALFKCFGTALGLVLAFCIIYEMPRGAGIEAARYRWQSSSDPVVLSGKLRGEDCPVVPPADGLKRPIACYSDDRMLRGIISTDRVQYLFVTERCDIAKYSTCGGLIFRVSTDGSWRTVTVHTGERRQ